jgi:hypothetical protein
METGRKREREREREREIEPVTAFDVEIETRGTHQSCQIRI